MATPIKTLKNWQNVFGYGMVVDKYVFYRNSASICGVTSRQAFRLGRRVCYGIEIILKLCNYCSKILKSRPCENSLAGFRTSENLTIYFSRVKVVDF